MGFLDDDFSYDDTGSSTGTSASGGIDLNNPSYNYSGSGTTTPNYDYDNNNNDYSWGNGGGYNYDYSGLTGAQTANLSNPGLATTGTVAPTSGWEAGGGAIKNFLNDIFTKGSTANSMGQGLAALASGYQNIQKAKALQSAAGQVDPWSSQRGFYQQQAQNAVTNPFSSPIVASQLADLQENQARKDAAAGRRSNSLLGDTSMMAEAAKIAQNYQAQMAAQGGANIQPSGLSSLLSSSAQAGTNGYLTPLATLFGQGTQDNTNTNYLSALSKFLQG
jgi:hypothetical protein